MSENLLWNERVIKKHLFAHWRNSPFCSRSFVVVVTKCL